MALSQETLDFIKNYQPSGGTSTDSGGIGSDVLYVLGLLSRPGKALWTGIDEAIKPEGSIYQGVKRGWYDEPGAKEAADVFGIPEGRPEDDWASWLGKEGLRLGTNILGDPLNLVPVAGIAGKAKTALAPAARAIGGTGIGKAFMHSAWGRPEIEEAIQAANRLKGERIAKATEAFQGTKTAESALDGAGLDISKAREAFERRGALPPEYEQALLGQHGLSAEALDRLNPLLEQFGYDPIQKINESELYRWLPRLTTEKGERYLSQVEGPAAASGKRVGGSARIAPEEFKSRSLKRVVDPEALARGELVNPDVGAYTDLPIVTQEKFLTPLESGGYLYKGKPVSLTEASLEDIYRARDLKIPEGSFVADPATSLLADQVRKANMQGFLETFDNAIQQGWVKRIEPGAALEKGYRKINIPGMEDYAAEKVIANRFENLARTQFDPSTPIGAVGEVLQKVFDTRAGQLFDKATRTWSRGQLSLHPGFHIANAVSNIPQAYLGDINAWNLPGRALEALNVQRGAAGEIVPGLANEQFAKEMANRGLMKSWSASEAADAIDKARQATLTSEYAPQILGEKLGGYATTVADKIKAAHDWGFEKVGQPIESNSRLMVAIDYLKKNAPDFVNMPVEQQAAILDKASAFAAHAMIDYSPTPFEMQLRKIIPFYNWQRGMIGRTGEQLLEQPQKLNRLGMTLDTAFEPMGPDDKRISDKWIQEAAPVMGAFGANFGTNPQTGQPQMLQLGRFLPHQVIEQLVSRPGESAWSWVNPMIKGPINLFRNWDEFKNRPIDQLAGGFPESVINPITNPWTGAGYEKAGGKTLGAQLPSGYQYITDLTPMGRYAREASDLMRGLGIYQDPYKPTGSMGEAIANYLTGSKYYSFDRAAQMKHREREYTELEKAIRRDMNYALKKGDSEGFQFYLQQLLKHQTKKGAALGFGSPVS